MQKEKQCRRHGSFLTVMHRQSHCQVTSWNSKLPLKLSYLVTPGVIIFEVNSVEGGFRRVGRIFSGVQVKAVRSTNQSKGGNRLIESAMSHSKNVLSFNSLFYFGFPLCVLVSVVLHL